MTKQDFEATAAIIRQAFERCATFETAAMQSAARETVKEMAAEFAASYGRQNSRFDRARFVKACGFE